MDQTHTKQDERVELLSLSREELTALMKSIGEPAYRATQLFTQLHRGLSPEQMTNIGKETRRKLAEVADYHLPRIERKLVSAVDGTVK